MILTYTGLRQVCCLQTQVLIPWLREPMLFAPYSRHRSPVCMTSWTILHYSHMCGWKLSGITLDWLVYCSGLKLWIMCVYSKCVSKWSMQRTCDNSVTWYWPSLGWGTLHCVVCRRMFCFTGPREPVLCGVFPCIMKCLVMKEWLVTFWQCVYFW